MPQTVNVRHSVHSTVHQTVIMVRPQIDLGSPDQRRVEQFAEEQGLRMPRAYAELLKFALDERVGPSDDELRAAYRNNRATARKVNEEWEHVSTEANQYLDDPENRGDRSE